MLSTYKTAVENHWRKVNDPFLLKHEIPAFQIDKTEGGEQGGTIRTENAMIASSETAFRSSF